MIEKGVITFDTPLSKYFPQFKPPFKIIDRIDEDGTPVMGEANKEITVYTLLNQTSGFGIEFGPVVEAWKKYKGTGFVNSCKKVSPCADAKVKLSTEAGLTQFVSFRQT